MKPVCEFITSEVLPGVRALIAKKMIENHGITQSKAAELLDTSQPAISHYKRDLRGIKNSLFRENPEIMEMIDSMSKRIMSGEVSPKQTTSEFCSICRYMREHGLIPNGD
jgi:predicted transcriptional regulator